MRRRESLVGQVVAVNVLLVLSGIGLILLCDLRRITPKVIREAQADATALLRCLQNPGWIERRNVHSDYRYLACR